MQSEKAGGGAKLPICRRDAIGIAAVLTMGLRVEGKACCTKTRVGATNPRLWRPKPLVPVPPAVIIVVAVVSWITGCHRRAACRQREHAGDHDKYEAFSRHGWSPRRLLSNQREAFPQVPIAELPRMTPRTDTLAKGEGAVALVDRVSCLRS